MIEYNIICRPTSQAGLFAKITQQVLSRTYHFLDIDVILKNALQLYRFMLCGKYDIYYLREM